DEISEMDVGTRDSGTGDICTDDICTAAISGAGSDTAAGAADPMTTLAAPPPPCDPASGALFADSSGLEALLRAESAANGETLVERVKAGASVRLISGTTVGLPDGREIG